MWDRRGFFKAIGGAILGTAIALQLPDILIPKPIIFSPHQAAYNMHQMRMKELGQNPLSFGEWHERMAGNADGSRYRKGGSFMSNQSIEFAVPMQAGA